ncbi:MAG TPA: DUF1015 domain-containing protein [Gemmatimonadales bacterium]|nr:DUF1015 domain-containing protein [Gemmatimonadales bacterium]
MGVDSLLITPFSGERYADAAALSRLIAPPYDVISNEQRRRYAAADPHNIVHLILPEAAGDANRYRAAAAQLAEWRATGVFVRDPGPSVYVVAQEFQTPAGTRHTRVGMFAAAATEPYETRRIRPHEKTHRGPKVDRLELLRATHTNLESIFLLAPDADGTLAAGLREVVQGSRAPDAAGELDSVAIRLWVVSGPDAERLAGAAAPPLYIADGHHRFETAVAYAGENPAARRLLAFVVSTRDPGLVVLPTHRVIYAGDRQLTALETGWRKYFDVQPVPEDADPVQLLATAGRDQTACVVATEGRNDHLLVLRPDAPLAAIVELGRTPAVRSLDVAIVERLVVQEILAAGQSTPTLTYTPNATAALELAHLGKALAAILLNPTRVDQVLAVADAGDVMPPKSTYFIPKVPSGLVLRQVDA